MSSTRPGLLVGSSFALPDLGTLAGQQQLAYCEVVEEARRRWRAARSARRLRYQLLFPAARKAERRREKQAAVAAAARAAYLAAVAVARNYAIRRQLFLERRQSAG